MGMGLLGYGYELPQKTRGLPVMIPKPSKRVTENGDDHTNKKAKTTEAIKILLKVSTVSNNSRRASVKDIPEPVTTSYLQPHLADHVLEAADSSDDDDIIGMPGLEDIDDDDDDDDPEDDEAELSMFCSMPSSSAF
jgi:hypothetical protein